MCLVCYRGVSLVGSSRACVCVCVCLLVTQSYPILSDPMDCSSPGSSVNGISQARVLEWVAILSSRGSSWPRNWTHISYDFCIAGRFFTTEPMGKLIYIYIVKREEWIISFIFRNKELLKLEGHLYLCGHIHGWFFDYSPDTLFHLSMNYLNDWSSIIGIGKYFMME